METITVTFGDCGENHVGMQKIGKMSDKGLSVIDLMRIKTYFDDNGYETSTIDLSIPEIVDSKIGEKNEACILIIRNMVKNSEDIFTELKALSWDKHAFMYGRVVNKIARHNLCISDEPSEPDYNEKRGRIVAWRDVPLLYELKETLEKLTDVKLIGEGNRYYDVKKCGIGFHGDSERRVVIGARFGCSMNLKYSWFYKSKTVGTPFEIILNNGDIYFMSDKATGNDWKKRNSYTLRHAAGYKYTKL